MFSHFPLPLFASKPRPSSGVVWGVVPGGWDRVTRLGLAVVLDVEGDDTNQVRSTRVLRGAMTHRHQPPGLGGDGGAMRVRVGERREARRAPSMII